MLAVVRSSSLQGIDARRVDVEVRVGKGKPRFIVIGLGDGAVREARERVVSALRSSGFFVPEQILVNLAPAEVKKEGSSFDVAMALGVLLASGQVPREALNKRSFHGELSLGGAIKPMRGTVAAVLEARENGIAQVMVPRANAREALVLGGVDVICASTLLEVVQILKGEKANNLPSVLSNAAQQSKTKSMHDVWGQKRAKRALLISASGGHNVLMVGPPGCGKSMLAERYQTLMPPLMEKELTEVLAIHSAAGLSIEPYLNGERPFRAPHHQASDVGMIGGGGVPRPGEVSLSHRGVLFMDEFPEFRRSVVEALRSPLESGSVLVTRAKANYVFPARFVLLAAMNPCPCGRLGSGYSCGCSAPAIQSYLRRLSEPLLDRIDLQVELEAVPLEALGKANEAADMEGTPLEQVIEAQARQRRRYGCLNSDVDGSSLLSSLSATKEAVALLSQVAKKMGLTARGYVRAVRVARTIADLDGKELILENHLAEALGYRSIDRIREYCGAKNEAARGVC